MTTTIPDVSDLPLVLTVPEAAEVLKLGRDRTYRMVRDGRIESFTVGNTKRIPRSAIASFITEQTASDDHDQE